MFLMRALLVFLSLTLNLPAALAAESETFLLKNKPKIYLMSALATEASDPEDLEESAAKLAQELTNILPSMRPFVPLTMNGAEWLTIQMDLVAAIQELKTYRERRIFSVWGMLNLESVRFRTLEKITRSLSNIREALVRSARAKELPEFPGLIQKLNSIPALIQKLDASDQLVFLESLQREQVGRPNEAPGPLLRTLDNMLGGLHPWFEFVFIRKATQQHLAAALSDPEAIGLIWIGHANSGGDFLRNDKILDANGVDVKNIFSEISPRMRYLALVGCKAKIILDGFQKKGFYKKNSLLHIEAHDDLAPLVSSAKQSVSRLYQVLMRNFPQEITYDKMLRWQRERSFEAPASNATREIRCVRSEINIVPFSVRTLIDTDFLSRHDIRIELEGKLLAFIPAGSREREILLTLDSELLPNRNKVYLRVVATASSDISSDQENPSHAPLVEITNPALGLLDVARLKSGTPVGTTTQVYTLNLPIDPKAILRQEFCF